MTLKKLFYSHEGNVKRFKLFGVRILKIVKFQDKRIYDFCGLTFGRRNNNNNLPNLFKDVPQKFELPAEDKPLVSIIIPVYNQYNYTMLCLWSILNNTFGVTYEVIIADDCSTDETRNIQEFVANIRVVRTDKNMRFLKNCNNAAKYARGKYILFLNNDTQVLHNWLRPLVDLIESSPSIGMVGSKLVYPDGTLQEAGGIIWNDAGGMNYGRNSNPKFDQYNYVKDVDYISGASIMLSRDLWQQMGGFDETFAPAYYEDTDLAFRIRQMGLRVVYQPLSEVVHFEGKSNGTDTGSGQKHYQVVNRTKFLEKWHDVLQSQHSTPDKVFFARDRSFGKKTLLFVDWGVLTFDRDCGSRASFEYLKFFVKNGFNVKFLPMCKGYEGYHLTALQQLGVEVICLNNDSSIDDTTKYLQEYGKYIDLIYLNRPNVAAVFFDMLRKYTNAKIVYQGHDLHHLRMYREYEVKKDPQLLKDAQAMENLERDLLAKMDVVTFFSDVEIDKIKMLKWNVPEMMTVPLYIYDNPDSGAYYNAAERRDIMFIGGYGHAPNVDAALWLVNDILPAVVARFPDIKLHLVGSNMPDSIKNLGGSNVEIHGWMSEQDLHNLYSKIKVSVIPLRYGAGIKGKVLEAVYNKVPVVTTDIGAEGIPNDNGVLTIANSADDIANAVIRMYGDDMLAQSKSDMSVEMLAQHYSGSALKGKIEHWLDDNAVRMENWMYDLARNRSHFVPITNAPIVRTAGMPKVFAYYLPQFHSIPENDDAHGRGFTEWTNVAAAQPLFVGHEQPKIPYDVGFYNLLDINVMRRQAELARMYGIYGFCFYYYWFSGKKVLEKPLYNFLNSDIDLHFHFCWANENWSKLWDGGNKELILEQKLQDDDADKFFGDILPFISDRRYEKIGNKPLLMIYRPALFDRKKLVQFTTRLNALAQEHGFDGFYFMASNMSDFCTPYEYGMNGIIEFPPHTIWGRAKKLTRQMFIPQTNINVADITDYINNKEYLYDAKYQVFKACFPSWDNAPRKAYSNGFCFNMNYTLFESWLAGIIEWTRQNNAPEMQYVYINAWNEWAEGAILEPTLRWGYAALDVVKRCLEKCVAGDKK